MRMVLVFTCTSLYHKTQASCESSIDMGQLWLSFKLVELLADRLNACISSFH